MAKMAIVINGIVANLVEVGPDTDLSIFDGELYPVGDEVGVGFIYSEELEGFVEPEPQVQMTEEEAVEYMANVPILPAPEDITPSE